MTSFSQSAKAKRARSLSTDQLELKAQKPRSIAILAVAITIILVVGLILPFAFQAWVLWKENLKKSRPKPNRVGRSVSAH
jgi:cytoskeletal protein RodZ